MMQVLQGQFFWGVVIGLLLSFIGAWASAMITNCLATRERKRIFREFTINSIRNISSIAEDMDASRDRSKVIFHDYLALIEVELNIFGRNREHLINLDDQNRGKVRKFMNDIAIKKTEIVTHLNECYENNRRANAADQEGRAPEATRIRTQGEEILAEAHKVTDRLVTISKTGQSIINDLLKAKRTWC